jgi:hypothetical protein
MFGIDRLQKQLEKKVETLQTELDICIDELQYKNVTDEIQEVFSICKELLYRFHMYRGITYELYTPKAKLESGEESEKAYVLNRVSQNPNEYETSEEVRKRGEAFLLLSVFIYQNEELNVDSISFLWYSAHLFEYATSFLEALICTQHTYKKIMDMMA